MTATRLKLAALSMATAVAATLTLAATSTPAHAADTVPISTAIVHRDLNLAAPSGERALRARVRSAAETLCTEPNQLSLKLLSVGRECIRDAIEGAEPQVQAAIASQRSFAARTVEGSTR